MPSLYAHYIAEREGKQILERPEGFATYSINAPECYIEDIYVLPEHRKSGVAAKLADVIAEEAKARGCTYLLGTVMPSAQGSTASLKVLLAYGFKLAKAETNAIYMVKELN